MGIRIVIACLIGLSALVATPLPLVPEPARKVVYQSSSDGFYDVAGYGAAAVSSVSDLAEGMVAVGESLFGINTPPPYPILIQLVNRPPDDTPDFEVRPQRNGALIVRLDWNEFTSMELCCQAVASAYLWHVLLAYDRDSGPPPYWLELALGHRLRTQLQPATSDALRNAVMGLSPMSLETIFTTTRDMTAVEIHAVGLHGFWVLQFWERLPMPRIDQQRLFQMALREPDWRRVFDMAVRRSFELPADRERYWAVNFQNLVRPRQPPFLNLAESRARIQQLNTCLLSSDVDDIRLRADELWPWRKVPVARSLIQQQLRELKLEIQRINPVYFNAIVSLGQIYEATLADDAEAFSQAKANFRNDMAVAQQTEQEIQQLLNW